MLLHEGKVVAPDLQEMVFSLCARHQSLLQHRLARFFILRLSSSLPDLRGNPDKIPTVGDGVEASQQGSQRQGL